MEYWEMSGMYIMGYEWDIYGKKGFDGKYDGIYDINGNIIGYSWEYRILMGSEWENQLEMRIFMEIIGNNGKIVCERDYLWDMNGIPSGKLTLRLRMTHRNSCYK